MLNKYFHKLQKEFIEISIRRSFNLTKDRPKFAKQRLFIKPYLNIFFRFKSVRFKHLLAIFRDLVEKIWLKFIQEIVFVCNKLHSIF